MIKGINKLDKHYKQNIIYLIFKNTAKSSRKRKAARVTSFGDKNALLSVAGIMTEKRKFGMILKKSATKGRGGSLQIALKPIS